jgi:hypothetical protein
MIVTTSSFVPYEIPSGIRHGFLTMEDSEKVNEFYKQSYPGNWFDERMLLTGNYVAIFEDIGSSILSIAGVHVYSEEYGVAALGNITTRPDHRGRELAAIATSILCQKNFWDSICNWA